MAMSWALFWTNPVHMLTMPQLIDAAGMSFRGPIFFRWRLVGRSKMTYIRNSSGTHI